MYPLRFIEKILLLVSVMRASAQWSTPQHPYPFTPAHLNTFFPSHAAATLQEFGENAFTGNGNTLTAPEIAQEPTANWYAIWLKGLGHQHQHQQRQHVEHQQPNFRIQNVALPLLKQRKHSTGEPTFQANSFEWKFYRSDDDSDTPTTDIENGGGNEDEDYSDSSEAETENSIEESEENLQEKITPTQNITYGDNKLSETTAEDNFGSYETADNVDTRTLSKRIPMPVGGHAFVSANGYARRKSLQQPHYPRIDSNVAAFNSLLKREQNGYAPSISGGAITHLGNFFKDLSKNVNFAERSQLSQTTEKLLHGDHPLRMLQEEMESGDPEIGDKTAEFLNALRTYRPSQKIRSLVAMNPRGYKGSQFIDPNYMWVGLGK